VRDALGSLQSALLLGGGSDIALATARALVARRTRTLVLAAREPSRLEEAAADLRERGAGSVELVEFDARATGSHAAFVDEQFDRHGDIDLVLLAFGVLGDEERYRRDGLAALQVMETNLSGAVSVAAPVARRLEEQGHGTLVVLSSVAAERARKSNFVYGASKAGLDAFAQGLGDSLHGSGVNVVVVRPGFVKTKMTAGREPTPLSATPEAVAEAIVDGVARGAHTVWVPPPLRFVMSVLRHLPRPLFRRLEI